jgi:hypothetical protein
MIANRRECVALEDKMPKRSIRNDVFATVATPLPDPRGIPKMSKEIS